MRTKIHAENRERHTLTEAALNNGITKKRKKIKNYERKKKILWQWE